MDYKIAQLLNESFVSIKVDKEERPDIDSVYMSFCQAFSGSGGWPASIFMTPEQRPFFAGTYFPKNSRGGMIGFEELLGLISRQWKTDRAALLSPTEGIIRELTKDEVSEPTEIEDTLPEKALKNLSLSFDRLYGGFGGPPKFPSPHILTFLLAESEKRGDRTLSDMAEKTLMQMYKGGLFDHIGGGFYRYSTDRYYLVPHFEKMLTDNALLISAYCKAYDVTKKEIYKTVAIKTAAFVLSQMNSPKGGFYSALDADSGGGEGGYYLFTPDEVAGVLGNREAKDFCEYYDITPGGNFEGKSIPNLLKTERLHDAFDPMLEKLNAYRKERFELHRDEKILTFRNSLMVSALLDIYRVSGNELYRRATVDALEYMESKLCGAQRVFAGNSGKMGETEGFLDDYAGYIKALLDMYEVSFEARYIRRAEEIMSRAAQEFFDYENGGFFLYAASGEKLIARPKESYDGAYPCGNSLMAQNLVRLMFIDPGDKYERLLESQLKFMSSRAKVYPEGCTAFLTALSEHLDPYVMITVAGEKGGETNAALHIPLNAMVRFVDPSTGEYKLLDGETAYYICKDHACLAPMKEREFYAYMDSL